MKTSKLLPIALAGLAVSAFPVSAQNAPAVAAEQPSAAEGAERPARDTSGGLRFNFRGAPLETVLNYLSEAAGFVIVLETPVRGNVDMWSAQPVSRQEAVQLLNLAINKSGYTAVLKGRTLVVSSKEDARKRSIPIRTGNDPRQIPDNAEMVMQIIPLERIDASQAASDLATLLPNSATITANVDSNSLVVTDTQSNVRHIVELVSALDGSAGSVASMPGMENCGLKWAPRHSSRCRAPLRISLATGNMSPRALVNTTFWLVQLPVSDTAHCRQRSSSRHTSS